MASRNVWYPQSMLSAATVEPIPLSTDANGVIRVAGTRVTLETVVGAFETGATPEEIAQDFPVLRLDDIYAVVTYYLRHRQRLKPTSCGEGHWLRRSAGTSSLTPLRQVCASASWRGLAAEPSAPSCPGFS
jgi:uncharacterized protein (DUF433 family)